jgi:hypothetical protein
VKLRDVLEDVRGTFLTVGLKKARLRLGEWEKQRDLYCQENRKYPS